jgi:transcriptional regulator with XRE-family HTH domain
MDDLKQIIAQNIIDLRKSMPLTQAELAEKLNYTDKAVSKWERAESIPDVIVLKQIADLFGVSVDYLLKAEHEEDECKAEVMNKYKKRNRFIITLLATMLVWLIATTVFVCFGIFEKYLWAIFVYALPITMIVLLVFNSIWGKPRWNYLIISLLMWSTLVSVYLSLMVENVWLIFIIGIPAQIIILLWSGIKLEKKKK